MTKSSPRTSVSFEIEKGNRTLSFKAPVAQFRLKVKRGEEMERDSIEGENLRGSRDKGVVVILFFNGGTGGQAHLGEVTLSPQKNLLIGLHGRAQALCEAAGKDREVKITHRQKPKPTRHKPSVYSHTSCTLGFLVNGVKEPFCELPELSCCRLAFLLQSHVVLSQVVLQLPENHFQLVDFAAYSASSAAPSASTTRLVSSLEICRASALCMSVIVQKDATPVTNTRLVSPQANTQPSQFQRRVPHKSHGGSKEECCGRISCELPFLYVSDTLPCVCERVGQADIVAGKESPCAPAHPYKDWHRASELGPGPGPGSGPELLVWGMVYTLEESADIQYLAPRARGLPEWYGSQSVEKDLGWPCSPTRFCSNTRAPGGTQGLVSMPLSVEAPLIGFRILVEGMCHLVSVRNHESTGGRRYMLLNHACMNESDSDSPADLVLSRVGSLSLRISPSPPCMSPARSWRMGEGHLEQERTGKMTSDRMSFFYGLCTPHQYHYEHGWEQEQTLC
ncbi:unnamed protein product [Menidia menidia]|uniref:(Atlantic silverside) hypothetical protein n=1 Tax=Menidia menidia TaxID=238744 RepID=A0A8S4C0P9_9TELE|nr:unnamed protein product [Menidia menidia]